MKFPFDHSQIPHQRIHDGHCNELRLLSASSHTKVSSTMCAKFITAYGMKTNWCHYFIRILLGLYMFWAHRPIFRRVRTTVHTTIPSVSVPRCSLALYVAQHTEQANRAAQILNQWLCEQLYELS